MSLIRHFDRLDTLRDKLEERLLLQETRHCFGDEDIDDGTIAELRDRISELTTELSALSYGACHL